MRFVSEFGAQSVPESASRVRRHVAAWPELDWEALREHHGLEVDVMLRAGAAGATTRRSGPGARRRSATRPTVLRHHIETLRRLKYRPTGGFCFSWLADPAPMISASVLDHDRAPKLAWQAVIEACRPVIVVTDPLPAELAAGVEVALDVHVVNDLRVAARRRHRVGHVHMARRPPAVGVPRRRRRRLRAPWSAACELAVPDEPGDLLLGVALSGRDESDAEITATRRAGARIVVA